MPFVSFPCVHTHITYIIVLYSTRTFPCRGFPGLDFIITHLATVIPDG